MSGAIERCIEHCSEGGVDGERWSRDKAAARAELAAKDAEIEQLREALGEIDRVWEEDLTGEIPYIVTNALSSLPPSDMRLVSLERLREIEWAGWTGRYEAECCPVCRQMHDHTSDCWLGNAIRDAEREKG